MRKRCLPLLAGLAVLTACTAFSQIQDQPPPTQEGVEVMARGPVHEAFAEPTAARPEASPVIPKQPPEPVDETPPEQKPEGNDVRWVPGYWAWDDDANDYLWVSGCWRDFPPGQTWVAGHWQEVEGGWQWAPGFWTDAQLQEVQYVPPPPPSIDAGPSAPAPAADSVYVPGCWIYQQTRYLWRPGFWAAHHPEWTYMPAHYVWSPGGCVFVEGFWDHPLHERGLLFAPVRLAQAVVTNRSFTYVPQYVVQPDFLIGAMFVRPGRQHYYFGDYFEPRYAKAGYVPWVDYRTSKVSYDANFAYYRQAFARDKTWETNLRGLYAARSRGDVPRPPATLVQQNKVINNFTVNKVQNVTVNKNINLTNVQNVNVLAPVTKVNNTRVTALASLGRPHGTAIDAKAPLPIKRDVIKTTAVGKQELVQHKQLTTQFRQVAVQRQQTEAKLLTSNTRPVLHTDKAQAVKLDLQKLAPAKVTGKPPVQPNVHAPPPRPMVPKHVEQAIAQHQPLPASRPPAQVKKVPPPKGP